MKADAALIGDLVAANHILAHFDVLDGWGHVSVRHDKRPDRFLIARSLAPALVGADDIMELDLEAMPVAPDAPTPYLEVFIHSEIYRARPDVQAVVHSHSARVLPFTVTSAPLRPIGHVSAFLGSGAPVFEIRDTGALASDLLIRDRSLGAALALTLGNASIALMRGHGMAVVGPTIQIAVHRAVYADVNAQEQSIAQNLGSVTFLNEGEALAATAFIESGVMRPWELWKREVSGRAASR